MATCLDVIESAYRRSGIRGRGKRIDATDKDVGMDRLRTFYKDMAEGLFGRQEDVLLTNSAAHEARELTRVVNTAGAVVTLPAQVRDAFSGLLRPPHDCALVTVVTPGNEPTINVYDANRAEWQDVNSITLNGYAPLTNRWEDGMKNILAVLLADDIGYPITPLLSRRAGSARLSIASRYGSTDRASKLEFY